MTRSLLLLLLIVVGSLFTLNVQAQMNSWRSYIEQLSEDGVDELSINNMFEELSMLELNPMNLNSVSRQDLESFPLL